MAFEKSKSEGSSAITEEIYTQLRANGFKGYLNLQDITSVPGITVTDSWPGSDYRYYKVLDIFGNTFIIKLREPHNSWEIVFFSKAGAKAIK